MRTLLIVGIATLFVPFSDVFWIGRETLAQETEQIAQVATPDSSADSVLDELDAEGIAFRKRELKLSSVGKTFHLVFRDDQVLMEGIPALMGFSIVNESGKDFYGLSLTQGCKCAVISGVRGKQFKAGQTLDVNIKIAALSGSAMNESITILGFPDESDRGEPSVVATIIVQALVFPPFSVESNVRKRSGSSPDGAVRYLTSVTVRKSFQDKIDFDPKQIGLHSDMFVLEDIDTGRLPDCFDLSFRLVNGKDRLSENETFVLRFPFTLKQYPEKSWTFSKLLTFVGESPFHVAPTYVELKQADSGEWTGDVIVMSYLTRHCP